MRYADRAPLERAKARLDTLDLYPQPVRIGRVRVIVLPLFFRLPPFRRFKGYALFRTILLKFPPGEGTTDDLLTHELCHIWQGQNERLRMLLTYLTRRYRNNPYEAEAREAAAQTRSPSGSAASV